MRYYCLKCKTEVITCPRDTECLYCGRRMIKIPEYETPEQYEKRTVKKWNGAVWFRPTLNKVCEWSCTSARLFKQYKNLPQEIEGVYKTPEWQVLCASLPEPPPEDWEPTE